MDNPAGFYTMKGYSLQESGRMTNAMEDYLEMIARLSMEHAPVRVNDLARALHVKAPSVTKMVQQLAGSGYLHAKKYGEIVLTDQGRSIGDYLLYRHEVLERFLCRLNRSESELEQVEKIEHFLDRRTVRNLEGLLRRL